MKFFLVGVTLMLAIVGCKSEPVGKVSAAHAVQTVQESQSTYPGVDTSDAIAGLLSILDKQGSHVDISGWTQDYRSGGTHDVWFKVNVDDKQKEFHWVITPDGTIEPANDLAQNVTPRQQAKP